jgi:hypothetical protein
MSRTLDSDPIDEARRQWVNHDWAQAADGMAAVTSIVRVQQIMLQRIDAVLRPLDLTFARYEILTLLSFTKHQCHQRCRPVRGAGICRTTTPPFGSTGSPSIHYEIGAQAICESNNRTECRSIRTTRTHSGADKLTIGNSAHITNQCGGLLNTAAQPLFHNLTHLKKENN